MKQIKVLLVEDDESARFGYSRYLQKENFNVDQAQCLAEAKMQLQNRNYDALILDLDLPDGDGFACLKDIRNKNSVVPILIVTGSASRTAEECLAHGANCFLEKPVSMPQLRSALRSLLNLATDKHR